MYTSKSRTQSRREVLDAALKKIEAHDRSFRKDRSYSLAYRDGTKVLHIPGTVKPFILVKYKEYIGKRYTRIVLFLFYAVYEAVYEPDDYSSVVLISHLISFLVCPRIILQKYSQCTLMSTLVAYLGYYTDVTFPSSLKEWGWCGHISDSNISLC